EPGRQFRMYEVAGIGHVDSRDNVRLLPNPCTRARSLFPLQAYMSVGLHHLFRWVDQGIPPPRAPRILIDRDTYNDGSMMALDEHGNPLGGIRSPYVDVPVAKYAPFNTAREPLIDGAAAWIVANGGIDGARIMCRLSAYQEPFSASKLRELYGDKRTYLRRFEQRLDELEREGWSLPVYRQLILADAAAIDFRRAARIARENGGRGSSPRWTATTLAVHHSRDRFCFRPCPHTACPPRAPAEASRP